ncbi:MAG: alpha/beta fold hydrolase [Bryobacteraceae bacterium]
MRLAVPLFLFWIPAVCQQQFASLGDLKLESGEVLRDCRIGYRTFGKLNAARSNSVLFPTWFTGRSGQLAASIGPGKLVDSSRYYVIAVDALANGVSSSPSNSKVQPRMKFPRVTIGDMAASQHALLTRVLKIPRLRAVVGISMGGMQAFQWMVAYPEFLDRAVPVAGSPKLTSYDLLLWQAEIDAIRADRDWRGGNYRRPPAAGLRAVAGIHELALTTPEYRARETAPAAFAGFYASLEKQAVEGMDANDRIRQLEAMMSHDVSRAFGGNLRNAAAAVRAKTLVVVALRDHMVNPRPALEFAKLLQAATLELDSDCGHLSPGCEESKVVPRVAAFLE